MPDAVDRLLPHLAVGERVTLVVGQGGDARDVIGFVTELDADAMAVVDARGREHRFARAAVQLGKRVGVSLGRNPLRASRASLDADAAAIGAAGEPYVARISDLLAGLPFPVAVPPRAETALFGDATARVSGEWLTLSDADPEQVRAAAWWATRMGARSVQVRLTRRERVEALLAVGFVRLP